MTPEELRRDEASRWLAVAAKDLKSARLLAREEPTGSVFHSQQEAEKSAKALLALHNVPFRRTHDLQELGNQCAEVEPTLVGVLAEAEDLTDYAVVFRYLDAPHEPDPVEATSALQIAGRLYAHIRSLRRVRASTGTAPGRPQFWATPFVVLHRAFGGRRQSPKCERQVGMPHGAFTRSGLSKRAEARRGADQNGC